MERVHKVWKSQITRVKALRCLLDSANDSLRTIEGVIATRARFLKGVTEIARGGLAVPLHKDLDWEMDDDEDEDEDDHNGGVKQMLSDLATPCYEQEGTSIPSLYYRQASPLTHE